MELLFKTEKFEGPLDLLLTLISKHKMNIFDIKITELFEQYMQAVGEVKRLDMEVAGEFITMAAELMYIKSRMLLPKSEEEDPRQELVRKLMEYQAAKDAARALSERAADFSGRFEKDTDEIKPDFDADVRLDAQLLSAALARIFLRSAEEDEIKKSAAQDAIKPITHRKIVSVQGKIMYIIRRMYSRGTLYFDDLFDGVRGRAEIVTVFYALLELLRVGRVEMRRAEGDRTSSDVLLTLCREHNRKTAQTV